MRFILQKSTWILLRFPSSITFSVTFFAALSQLPVQDMLTTKSALVFGILHIFLYPGVNAYNSYYDKDEKAIGGVEFPPPVTKELLVVALGFKGIVLVLAGFVNWYFFGYCAAFVGLSVAYSHPSIRLKARPIVCCLILGFMYCYFGMIEISAGISGSAMLNVLRIHLIALQLTISGIGLVPLSQLWQHEEDGARGDVSLSMMLGVVGSFIWYWVFIGFGGISLIIIFYMYYPSSTYVALGIAFLICGTPPILAMIGWTRSVVSDPSQASNYSLSKRPMWLQFIFGNVFFIALIAYTHYFKVELPN